MSRTRAFFLEEAAECLGTARRELSAASPSPARLHAAVRQLRGSAQLARYGDAARVAGALESRLKPVARGSARWTGAMRDAALRTTQDLAALLEAIEAGRIQQDERAETQMDRQPVEAGVDVVDVGEIEYRGQAALDRALELRPAVEDAIVAEEGVGEILEELFDLIRLARL